MKFVSKKKAASHPINPTEIVLFQLMGPPSLDDVLSLGWPKNLVASADQDVPQPMARQSTVLQVICFSLVVVASHQAGLGCCAIHLTQARVGRGDPVCYSPDVVGLWCGKTLLVTVPHVFG